MPIVDEDEIAKLPKVGDLLASKYRLTEIIGHGGMGVVFAARHEALAQSVAVKFLRPQQANDDEAIRRFLREARAAASLRSTHAARVFDIDQTPAGIPFLVMERLHGANVDRVLETRGPFAMADAVDCILQACDALAEAHGQGIVHRDLKPSNLFLSSEPGGALAIKVLDFGISKAMVPERDRAETSLTGPHAVLGSPQYMAPEQVMARAVDGRTDIWALGGILFELLTQRAPFAADSVPHLYAMILSSPPMALRSLLPKAPPALDSVIARCLEKSPAQRPADIGELAGLLAPFGSKESAALVARIRSRASHSPALATESGPRSTPVSRHPPRSGSALELGPTEPQPPLDLPGRRARLGAIVGSTLAVIAVILAVLAVSRHVRSTESTLAPQTESQTSSPVPAPIASAAPPSQSPLPTEDSPASAPVVATAASEPSPARPKCAPTGSAPAGRVRDLRGIKLLQ